MTDEQAQAIKTWAMVPAHNLRAHHGRTANQTGLVKDCHRCRWLRRMAKPDRRIYPRAPMTPQESE